MKSGRDLTRKPSISDCKLKQSTKNFTEFLEMMKNQFIIIIKEKEKKKKKQLEWNQMTKNRIVFCFFAQNEN